MYAALAVHAGHVCEVYDNQEQRIVAIKKIHRVFEDLIDCKRILREIAILNRLNHDHIVKILDILVPNDLEKFDVRWQIKFGLSNQGFNRQGVERHPFHKAGCAVLHAARAAPLLHAAAAAACGCCCYVRLLLLVHAAAVVVHLRSCVFLWSF